ncbi:Wzy polymerase domain-containing protein [Serratia ureilytica]
MLVHTQLEYPFYLSAPHWLAFAALLALLDGQTGELRPLPFAKASGACRWRWRQSACWGDGDSPGKGAWRFTQSERTMLASIDSIEQMPLPAAWIYRERKPSTSNLTPLVYNQTR